MAIAVEPFTKRIILDSVAVTAAELWGAWVNWLAASDNMKYPVAFRQAGGDALGSGLFIPAYMFLQNGWRIRPMEAHHQLVITGNLFVEEGGSPLVQTLGNFNVAAQLTVPVQAQGIATGGLTPTLQQIRDAMLLPASTGEPPIDSKLQQPFLTVSV